MSDTTIPTVTDADDLAVHVSGLESTWDSWRFVLFDAGRGIHGLVELEGAPTDECCSHTLVLWSGTRLLCHETGTGVPLDVDGSVRRAGPLALDCEQPNDRWRIAYRDDAAVVDLRWRGLAPAVRLGRTPALQVRHYEQSGALEGSIRVGDERISITGFAQRQRTWGARLWEATQHGWSSCVFFDETLHSHQSIITIGRRDTGWGHVYRGGQPASLTLIDVVLAQAYNDGPPTTGAVELEDVDGRMLNYSLAPGAALTELRPTGSRFAVRHMSFPRFTACDRSAIGYVDYWYTDRDLARPHLVVMDVAAEEVGAVR